MNEYFMYVIHEAPHTTGLTATLLLAEVCNFGGTLIPSAHKNSIGKTHEKCILLTGHIPYIPPFPDQQLWLSLL